MRIVAATPGSVLWLFSTHPEVQHNLRGEAEARHVSAGRLVFADKLPHNEHLARHQLADLFLDTPLVNAITTAVDSLWAGLPVLTVPGSHFCQRACASIVTAAGLAELVAADLAEYERQAIHLAQHRDKLRNLRERLIAGRNSCPLFDTTRKVRQLEQAYELMYERWQQGEPPAPINLDPDASERHKN